LKKVAKGSFFLTLSIDEVTIVDNESWMSIHGYVFEILWNTLVLLHLEKVIDNVTIKIILQCNANFLLVHNDIIKVKIGKKLVSIITNGGFVNLPYAKLVF
jgi:hypothetical protein